MAAISDKKEENDFNNNNGSMNTSDHNHDSNQIESSNEDSTDFAKELEPPIHDKPKSNKNAKILSRRREFKNRRNLEVEKDAHCATSVDRSNSNDTGHEFIEKADDLPFSGGCCDRRNSTDCNDTMIFYGTSKVTNNDSYDYDDDDDNASFNYRTLIAPTADRLKQRQQSDVRSRLRESRRKHHDPDIEKSDSDLCADGQEMETHTRKKSTSMSEDHDGKIDDQCSETIITTKFNRFSWSNCPEPLPSHKSVARSEAQCNKSKFYSSNWPTSIPLSLCSFVISVFNFSLNGKITEHTHCEDSPPTHLNSSSSEDEEVRSASNKFKSCRKRVTLKSKFDLRENSTEWQSQTANKMPRNTGDSSNRYQPLYGVDDQPAPVRLPRKLSSRKKSHNLGGQSGYSKLNHNNYKIREQKTSCQDFKRLLLLVVIITICCLILWQVYQVLVVGYNFLGVVNSPSKLGEYKHYAVSTDAKPCAKVGSDLLAKGGSAVDAAVGTLLCMGVVLPNSLGIGGGCFITIYDAKSKTATIIDGRETAPDYAGEYMFADDPMQASRGPLSVGVPGELAATFTAHQMFGRLNWSQLFDASIDMAEKGVPMVEHLSFALRARNHAKYIRPELAEIYINPKTGDYYQEGDIFIQTKLAETLKRIRDNGAEEFYGGLTGQLFIEDLKKQGGNMTLENLKKYEAIVRKPLSIKLDNDLQLFTAPLPASGIVLSVIMKIMKEFGYYKPEMNPKKSFEAASLYYHRLTEAFKFAYAQRAGLEDMPDDVQRMEQLVAKLLSDEFISEVVGKIDGKTHSDDRYGGNEYFSEDHGTAHVSVIDAEGNAVAITSSINLYFGSGLVSPSTGITYNDVMDDFVSPNITNKFKLVPSKFNHIKPGRRPLSSMAPSIFTDSKGAVKLVIGASGGTKITTAVASVSLRHCFLEDNIKMAVDGPRIHHQFLPNKIYYELNFPQEMLHSLVERGHDIEPIRDRSSIVMAVASNIVNGTKFITANSDYRKGGTVEGL